MNPRARNLPPMPPPPDWWPGQSSSSQPRRMRGLGDVIERVLSTIGGRRLKRFLSRLGFKCGCSGRQLWLNKLFPFNKTMKTKIAIIIAAFAGFIATANAQELITTNILSLTYVNGTNNGIVYYETNVFIPKQRIVLNHLGITNNNALGRSNIIARLQLSIDASNTNWVTLETFYPTVTNSISDSVISTFGKISLPLRVQIVTTNSIGVAVYSQRIIQ